MATCRSRTGALRRRRPRVKRALPDSIVISYQGDGDLAAIGGNEILHAANRGENITVVLRQQRDLRHDRRADGADDAARADDHDLALGPRDPQEGFPLRVCELLATLEGPPTSSASRWATASTMRARKAIQKALQNQVEGRGFSLVEVLSPARPAGV